MREAIDPKIAEKIRQLTLQGVRKRGEMRRHLDNFVRSEMFQGRRSPPSYRRRYYPRRKDLDYHIAKAKIANRLANLDQDNLEVLIQKWRTSSSDLFYFRKREERVSGMKEMPSPDSLLAHDEPAGGDDDEEEPEPKPQEGEQPLLFCSQTEQQQRLLLKYGNDMCLMDATYKTTRYSLPLFFLCVRTNVCYQVVGTFVVQYSTTEAIGEALHIFREWNPSWNPRYFMTDFAEEEISALENVFEGKFSFFDLDPSYNPNT